MENKKGFGMHRVFPVENIEFCCEALKDTIIGKGDFIFTYQSMEEDERDYSLKWHVRCPFCHAAIIISEDSMEIDKSK